MTCFSLVIVGRSGMLIQKDCCLLWTRCPSFLGAVFQKSRSTSDGVLVEGLSVMLHLENDRLSLWMAGLVPLSLCWKWSKKNMAPWYMCLSDLSRSIYQKGCHTTFDGFTCGSLLGSDPLSKIPTAPMNGRAGLEDPKDTPPSVIRSSVLLCLGIFYFQKLLNNLRWGSPWRHFGSLYDYLLSGLSGSGMVQTRFFDIILGHPESLFADRDITFPTTENCCTVWVSGSEVSKNSLLLVHGLSRGLGLLLRWYFDYPRNRHWELGMPPRLGSSKKPI
jgi:hypothetical protein